MTLLVLFIAGMKTLRLPEAWELLPKPKRDANPYYYVIPAFDVAHDLVRSG